MPIETTDEQRHGDHRMEAVRRRARVHADRQVERHRRADVDTSVSETAGPTAAAQPSARSRPAVELAFGRTLSIGGIFQDSVRQQINGLPGLGDIPILGALFRSREFMRSQTELVILVTPYMAETGCSDRFADRRLPVVHRCRGNLPRPDGEDLRRRERQYPRQLRRFGRFRPRLRRLIRGATGGKEIRYEFPQQGTQRRPMSRRPKWRPARGWFRASPSRPSASIRRPPSWSSRAIHDRRMSKVALTTHNGGIDGAVETYKSNPTPNLIIVETSAAARPRSRARSSGSPKSATPRPG